MGFVWGENLVLDDENVFIVFLVYVYIFFCRCWCFYCDFLIVVVGERIDINKVYMDVGMMDYVDLVCWEICFVVKVNSSKFL